MQVTFLGTGTSTGVPMIGCQCNVCASADPKDKRLRVAVFIESPSANILIDIGPDFRQQMLRENITKLDAVLITHEHHDHIASLDEVRAFNFLQRKSMPVYSSARVKEKLEQRFDYVFEKSPYPGVPRIDLIPIHPDQVFQIEGIDIQAIEYMHGSMPVLGFRIKDFTYLTDFKSISDAELEKVKGTKILVISAIHYRTHHSHINVPEALEIIEKLQPEQAYITHISHWMGMHADVTPNLPPNVALAWDGLKIEL